MQCYNFPSMDLLIQIYYKLRSTNKQQQENGEWRCILWRKRRPFFFIKAAPPRKGAVTAYLPFYRSTPAWTEGGYPVKILI